MEPITSKQAVNSADASRWVIPSVTRRVSPKRITTLFPVPDGHWCAGGLFLAKVRYVGRLTHVENTRQVVSSSAASLSTPLIPGMPLLVCLGERRGSSTCICRIPDEPCYTLDLHSPGGQCAARVPGTENTLRYRGTLTTVQLIGAVGDANGPLQLRDFALKSSAEPQANKSNVIAVLGSCMDSGKTMTAAAIVSALVQTGQNVGYAKVTGVGNLGDLVASYAFGARPALSLLDFGYPSSIGLSPETAIALFHQMLNRLDHELESSGYSVVEFGDGLLFRENKHLLADKSVRARISHVVLAASDALGALKALELLDANALTDRLRFVGGLFACNTVSQEQFRENCACDVPLIDPVMVNEASAEWPCARMASLFC